MLFILKAPPEAFAVFISVAAFIGLLEFYAMSLPERRGEGYAAAAVGALLPAVHGWVRPDLLPVLAAVFLGFGMLFLFRLGDIRKGSGELALLLTGFLYVPLLLTHMVLLRLQPHGIQWIFLLLILIMSGDTVAYYVGSALGRHRLYPEVSPKKSVEGAVGGFFGTVAGAFIARATFFPELSVADAALCAAVVGPLGQIGDLFESMLKRSFGVKDSGTIIPGHGGILDRLDSILFGLPALYWYSVWFFREGG